MNDNILKEKKMYILTTKSTKLTFLYFTFILIDSLTVLSKNVLATKASLINHTEKYH